MISFIAGKAAEKLLLPYLKKAGGAVLAKVIGKGGASDVIESLAAKLGLPDATPDVVLEAAKNNPEEFNKAVESVTVLEGARWATMLAEVNHGALFVAGARPAILWACFGMLAYGGIIAPVATWVVQLVGIATGVATLPAMPAPPDIVWETLGWLIPLLYGTRALEGALGAKSTSL